MTAKAKSSGSAGLTVDRPHILLLAGTHEARLLARQIRDRFSGIRLTVSFAGVVKDLPDLGVKTRIGGFGGADGLAAYAQAENISIIVDATHPFAAQMSRNAFEAAERLKLPLIRLERPAWVQEPGDIWQSVASIPDAVTALPAKAHAFLAVGRKEIRAFYRRNDVFGVVRMIEPPGEPLPDGWRLLLSRPPQDVRAEIALFREHAITHIVAKNSGGTRSHAKIAAARELELPVIMIERPVLAKCCNTADSARAVLSELARLNPGFF